MLFRAKERGCPVFVNSVGTHRPPVRLKFPVGEPLAQFSWLFALVVYYASSASPLSPALLLLILILLFQALNPKDTNLLFW
jgi:hypothetical protein